MNERELFEDNYRGITISEFHKHFYFDTYDGILFHKMRDISDFLSKQNPLLSVNAWNARWANKPAGNINKTTGYLKVKFRNKNLFNHRIIYLMTYGYLPRNLVIDHVDGDKLNNSPFNLRAISDTENKQNQRYAHNNSKLQVLGVSLTSSGKYQARISIYGEDKYLGSFNDIDSAACAYREAKKLFHVSQ